MHPSGFQFLILPLNSGNEFEFLITSGTRAEVFGPLKDIVSVPFPTVRTLRVKGDFAPYVIRTRSLRVHITHKPCLNYKLH